MKKTYVGIGIVTLVGVGIAVSELFSPGANSGNISHSPQEPKKTQDEFISEMMTTVPPPKLESALMQEFISTLDGNSRKSGSSLNFDSAGVSLSFHNERLRTLKLYFDDNRCPSNIAAYQGDAPKYAKFNTIHSFENVFGKPNFQNTSYSVWDRGTFEILARHPTGESDKPVCSITLVRNSESQESKQSSALSSKTENELMECLMLVGIQLKMTTPNAQVYGQDYAVQKFMENVRKDQGQWCLDYAQEQGVFK